MFEWLRRRRQYETHEAAQAAVLRQVMRLNQPLKPEAAAPAPFETPLFPVENSASFGPSDGGGGDHAGYNHCDATPGCDFGGSHH